MEYISLGALRLAVYEHLPQPIRAWLRRSIWYTLFTELVSITIMLLIPDSIWDHRFSQGGFLLGPSADIVNGLLAFSYRALPYLLIFNLLLLFLTLALITISLGTSLMMQVSMQRLIVVNAVPALVNLFVVGAVMGIFAVIIVVLLIVWAIIIMILITVFIGILSVLLGASS